MTYHYRAYTDDKKIVQGTVEAASESLAEAALYQKGYQSVLSIKEAPPERSVADLIPTLFGVKAQGGIDFARQLATLLESGIPILTALHLLEEQAASSALRKAITGLAEALQAGNFLSQALARYFPAFSNTHCQLIKASEQAGNLETGLRQVASYMERQMAMKQRITRAMVYPAVVMLMAIGVAVLLIVVALPPLVGLFTSLGADLPWATRMLINASSFLTEYSLQLLLGMFALFILVIGYLRLPSGRLALDRLMLNMPVIGPINIHRHMSHFCQTTTMLLKAGVRLPHIMDIVTQTVRNRVMRQALLEVREKLVQGEGLSQPMAGNKLFPKLMVEMVVVGEKTGNLDATLATLGDFYEERVDRRIDALITMIEPALTVGIGLVVVFIALSMLTPLYSILGSMK